VVLIFFHLSDYWKEESVKIEQNWVYSNISWTDYQRTREDAENIQVRQYHSINQQAGEEAENIEVQQSNSNTFSLDRPYQVTRDGAIDSQTLVIKSDGVKSTTSTQSHKTIRDMLWPLAQLLPAGKQHHKEWMYVAAAVVGMDSQPTPEALKRQ
jgi:hypothetical protein